MDIFMSKNCHWCMTICCTVYSMWYLLVQMENKMATDCTHCPPSEKSGGRGEGMRIALGRIKLCSPATVSIINNFLADNRLNEG